MRNRYVLLADSVAFVAAVLGAFALRFDFHFFLHRPEFVPYVIAAPFVKGMVFYGFGMYRRFWRYVTIDDLVALGIAVSAATAAMAAFVVSAVFLGFIYEFSRSVVVADGLLTLCAAGAIRLSVRLLGESQSRWRRVGIVGEKRVLIVGAGDAGTMVVREMQRNKHLGMVPVCFLDDDEVKIGKKIYGVPVRRAIDGLASVIGPLKVDEVIIAMPTASGNVLRRIAEDCRQAGISSKTIPGVFELLDGHVSVSRLREVDITDLLRRNPVMPRVEDSAYVTGRTVLVTGAGGSIGFELCRQVAFAKPARLVLLGHGENSIFEAYSVLRSLFPQVRTDAVIADIRDRGRIDRIFQELDPAIVFHAAAHKHVPLMEDNPEEAVSNNVFGTQHVVDAALRAGTSRFVMISSDKAVNPSSLMGASKRVAEALVRDAALGSGRAFVVVRFGNVLGSRGSVVPAFKRQIEKGGPVTITHPDMKRFFMTIPEAVHLVLQAGGLGEGGELFVLKMGEPLRVVQIAEDLIRLSGFNTDDVPIVFTGVRPGEKLEESLWEEGALVEQTSHSEILKVAELDAPGPRLAMGLGALAEASARGDREQIHYALKVLVPGFRALPRDLRADAQSAG